MTCNPQTERVRLTTSAPEFAPLHTGNYVFVNGTELVWRCVDDCPHLNHAEYLGMTTNGRGG